MWLGVVELLQVCLLVPKPKLFNSRGLSCPEADTQPRRVACAQVAPSKGGCGALPEQQSYVSSQAAARGGFIKLRGANTPLVVALGVVWGGVGRGCHWPCAVPPPG